MSSRKPTNFAQFSLFSEIDEEIEISQEQLDQEQSGVQQSNQQSNQQPDQQPEQQPALTRVRRSSASKSRQKKKLASNIDPSLKNSSTPPKELAIFEGLQSEKRSSAPRRKDVINSLGLFWTDITEAATAETSTVESATAKASPSESSISLSSIWESSISTSTSRSSSTSSSSTTSETTSKSTSTSTPSSRKSKKKAPQALLEEILSGVLGPKTPADLAEPSSSSPPKTSILEELKSDKSDKSNEAIEPSLTPELSSAQKPRSRKSRVQKPELATELTTEQATELVTELVTEPATKLVTAGDASRQCADSAQDEELEQLAEESQYLAPEQPLEQLIIERLLAQGWILGTSEAYDRKHALYPEDIYQWIESCSPEILEQLKLYHESSWQQQVLHSISEALATQGTLKVLREGVTIGSSGSLIMAASQPNDQRNDNLWKSYQANIYRIVPRLHYSPHAEFLDYSEDNYLPIVDLGFFINGIPVATAMISSPNSVVLQKSSEQQRLEQCMGAFLSGTELSQAQASILEVSSKVSSKTSSKISSKTSSKTSFKQEQKTQGISVNSQAPLPSISELQAFYRDWNKLTTGNKSITDEEPLFIRSRGAVVHFVISSEEIYLTTEVAGARTQFIPFNRDYQVSNAKSTHTSTAEQIPTSYFWEFIAYPPVWNAIFLRYAFEREIYLQGRPKTRSAENHRRGFGVHASVGAGGSGFSRLTSTYNRNYVPRVSFSAEVDQVYGQASGQASDQVHEQVHEQEHLSNSATKSLLHSSKLSFNGSWDIPQLVDATTGQKKIKQIVFPRYHQLDAVLRTIADLHFYSAADGDSYLFEHSAGSGKTATITWLAYQLASLRTDAGSKYFHSVIVVSDRNVIDQQLQNALSQIDRNSGNVVSISDSSGKSKSQQLLDALLGQQQIICVTLQTFTYLQQHLAKHQGFAHHRFAVIVDEAHSSQGGKISSQLKSTLLQAATTPSWEVIDFPERGEASKNSSVRSLYSLLEQSSPASNQQRRQKSRKTTSRKAKSSSATEKSAISPAETTSEAISKSTSKVTSETKSPSNICFFAFTATPKDKTYELFGGKSGSTNEPVSFHKYGMRQAIAEGFILDPLSGYQSWNYQDSNSTSSANLPPASNLPPNSNLPAKSSPPAKASQSTKVNQSAKANQATKVNQSVTSSSVSIKDLESPKRVFGNLAKIVKHFKEQVQPMLEGKAKAMIITSSRLAALRYKLALDALVANDPGYAGIKSLVSYSGTLDPQGIGHPEDAKFKLRVQKEYHQEMLRKQEAIRQAKNLIRSDFQKELDEYAQELLDSGEVSLTAETQGSESPESKAQGSESQGKESETREYQDAEYLGVGEVVVTAEEIFFPPRQFNFTEFEVNQSSHLGKDVAGLFNLDEYQFLIVADTFQTGFDQPKLCALYIDKSMAEPVDIIQTYSRVNRIYPGKNKIFICDFANAPERVVNAFRLYDDQATLPNHPDSREQTPATPQILLTNKVSQEIEAQTTEAQTTENQLASVAKAKKPSSTSTNNTNSSNLTGNDLTGINSAKAQLLEMLAAQQQQQNPTLTSQQKSSSTSELTAQLATGKNSSDQDLLNLFHSLQSATPSKPSWPWEGFVTQSAGDGENAEEVYKSNRVNKANKTKNGVLADQLTGDVAGELTDELIGNLTDQLIDEVGDNLTPAYPEELLQRMQHALLRRLSWYLEKHALVIRKMKTGVEAKDSTPTSSLSNFSPPTSPSTSLDLSRMLELKQELVNRIDLGFKLLTKIKEELNPLHHAFASIGELSASSVASYVTQLSVTGAPGITGESGNTGDLVQSQSAVDFSSWNWSRDLPKFTQVFSLDAQLVKNLVQVEISSYQHLKLNEQNNQHPQPYRLYEDIPLPYRYKLLQILFSYRWEILKTLWAYLPELLIGSEVNSSSSSSSSSPYTSISSTSTQELSSLEALSTLLQELEVQVKHQMLELLAIDFDGELSALDKDYAVSLMQICEQVFPDLKPEALQQIALLLNRIMPNLAANPQVQEQLPEGEKNWLNFGVFRLATHKLVFVLENRKHFAEFMHLLYSDQKLYRNFLQVTFHALVAYLEMHPEVVSVEGIFS